MKGINDHSAMFEPLEPRLLLGGADWLASAVAADHDLGVGAEDQSLASGAIAAAGETQVYRFTTRARGTITIRVTSADGTFDPFLQVYNGAGRLIRRNDNLRFDVHDSGTRFPTPTDQTYYVRVSGAKGSVGGYALSIISDPIDDAGNTFATARRLLLWPRAGAGLARGIINYAGDVDVRRFVAPKTGTMTIEQRQVRASQALASDLSVYDASGNLLGHADNPAETKATVSFPVVQGQTYYVKSAALGGTMGWYVIRVATAAAPAPAQTPAQAPGTPGEFVPGAQITTTTVSLPTGLQLVVLGTNAADVMTLSQTAAGLVLTTSRGPATFAGAYASLAIYGFGGSDTIRVTNAVTYNVTLLAGDGDDTIFAAGQGRDAIYGGAGNDLVVSVGGGADTLSGGDGLDSVWMDTRDALADASTAETAAAAVHRIDQFYRPTSDPAKAVSLEIAGQRIVDPVAEYPYVDFSSRPLFTDGPEYSDVQQGYLGDCYLLAALSSLADKDPTVIRHLIAPMGDGTYAVRFYRSGQAVYLRLDADLPAWGAAPVYADLSPEGELWVALVEKAYAQFRYGDNSYPSIEGGWMSAVYREVTNAPVTEMWINYSTPGVGQSLASHLAAGHAVTAATKSVPNSPFVGNHAYQVKSVETVGRETYVTVYNPWGVDGKSWDASSADGLLKVTLGQFQSSFIGLSISLA